MPHTHTQKKKETSLNHTTVNSKISKEFTAYTSIVVVFTPAHSAATERHKSFVVKTLSHDCGNHHSSQHQTSAGDHLATNQTMHSWASLALNWQPGWLAAEFSGQAVRTATGYQPDWKRHSRAGSETS